LTAAPLNVSAVALVSILYCATTFFE
jgi:hypothetical protein